MSHRAQFVFSLSLRGSVSGVLLVTQLTPVPQRLDDGYRRTAAARCQAEHPTRVNNKQFFNRIILTRPVSSDTAVQAEGELPARGCTDPRRHLGSPAPGSSQEGGKPRREPGTARAERPREPRPPPPPPPPPKQTTAAPAAMATEPHPPSLPWRRGSAPPAAADAAACVARELRRREDGGRAG